MSDPELPIITPVQERVLRALRIYLSGAYHPVELQRGLPDLTVGQVRHALGRLSSLGLVIGHHNFSGIGTTYSSKGGAIFGPKYQVKS